MFFKLFLKLVLSNICTSINDEREKNKKKKHSEE